MKQIVIASITLLVLVTSCKKDDLGTSGIQSVSITAMVDNVPCSFNDETLADTVFHSGAAHVLVIEGWQGAVGKSNYISFSIVNLNGPVTPGSYTPSSFYYWEQSDSTAFILSGDINPPQVNITSITGNSVEGTFSSSVFNNYGVDYTAMHTITEGKFNVKFNGEEL